MLLLLVLLLAGCAAGPSCSLERLAVLPVEMVGNLPVVQAEINGRRAALVLDTGASMTVLSPAAARRLGVPVGAAQVEALGAGGALLGATGVAGSVSLGGAAQAGVRVLVADTPPYDGLLGLNVLSEYELDLDSRGGQVVLYRARPCPVVGPDWEGPYRAVPVGRRARSNFLYVPVALDGQRLTGLLDTGASMSTVSIAAAGEALVTARMLQKAPTALGRSLNPEGFVLRPRRFGSLRVGPDELAAPLLAVADLPALAGDVLVGSDYLATRRVWIAPLVGRVFVRDAEAAQPRPR